jgi:arylsulfatase A-like enzyme/Flp pilus assembly protein TadD
MIKKKFYPVGIIASAVLLIITSISCQKRKDIKAQGYNLLVMTLDTMRADRIGAFGYEKAETPNLDDLAYRGVMFENVYTPVPLTLPAHCSIFTGRYPLGHQVRDNGTFFLDENETTLAERMKNSGYDTYAVIASYVLLSKFGLDQGFATYDDSLNADELLHNFYSEITADEVYDKFSQWFEKRGEQKFFVWIHFYDPHAPYTPPNAYRRGDSLSDLYDGEVAFTDVYVGKVIQDLKEKNVLENTLVVIVGDHGEAFGEHREYGHSIFCYEENLRVPLIFYNPRLFPEGLTVKSRINLIDIVPTLLEMYGMDIPSEVQGRSFAPVLDGKEEKRGRSFYVESMYGKESLGWAPLTGIIDAGYKYISLPEPELYDLSADPLEKNNLFAQDAATAKALDEKLKESVLEYSDSGGESRRELTAEDRRRLESLGYISSFSGAKGKALDPKQGILLQEGFNAVNDEIEKGSLDAAEAQLRNIASRNPEIKMPQYYELLAKVYELRPDPMGVISTWKEAVEAFPGNSQFMATLGFKLFQSGRLEEAEELGRRIIDTDHKSSQGFILLGSIEEKRHDMEKAREYFEKAAGLEPNNVQLKISLARSLAGIGQQEKALGICQEILDDETIVRNPENAGVLSSVGILLTEMNHLDQALQVLEQASSMDESNPQAWNYLGVVYYRQNDFDQALRAYQKAVELDPQFASAYNNLGALYLRRSLEQKDPSLIVQAVDAFNRAISNDSRLASAYNGRASAYKFSNRANDAIRDWKKALEIQPDFIDVYFNLGITYLQTGDKIEALRILNRCKEKFYDRLPASEQGRLDRLIAEASR